jgi:photosystem II stability/assembly factor-like uncharacterized protein
MHSRAAITAAALLAAALPALARSAAPEWALALEREPQHPVTVAAFFDEQKGVTGGCETPSYSAVLRYTADGGKTWSTPVIADSSSCRFGVEALAPNLAWSSGNGGDIRTSTDGGRTWTRLSNFGGTMPSQARLVSFADQQRGAVAAPRELGITSDGGKTWQRAGLPSGTTRIAAVSLVADGAGTVLRLLDVDGMLWASRDGGATWKELRSPLQDPIWDSPAAAQAALRFLPGGVGVLAAILDRDGVPTGRIHRTVDGGVTWTEEIIQGGFPPSNLTLSSDGTLLVSFDLHKLRVFRRRGP